MRSRSGSRSSVRSNLTGFKLDLESSPDHELNDSVQDDMEDQHNTEDSMDTINFSKCIILAGILLDVNQY